MIYPNLQVQILQHVKTDFIFPPQHLQKKLNSIGEHHQLVQHHKNNAYKQFQSLKIPDTKDEQWRYSKVPEIDYEQLVPTKDTVHCSKEQSVFVGSLDSFAQQYPERLSDCFVEHKNALAAFVDSCFLDSLVVYVPAGYDSAQPFVLETVVKNAQSLVINKLIIIIGRGARVNMRSVITSADGSGIVYNSLQVIVESNAQFNMRIEQKKLLQMKLFCHYQFIVHQQSTLNVTTEFCDAQYSKAFFDVNLRGDYAQATLAGGYILKENQQIDIVSHLNHTAKNSTSSLRLHGALFGAARAAYHGTIKVLPQAHKTNAEQYNKNMILAPGAHAISVPNLEVATNDIQCRHGSAVGRFDAQMLFYMQSRGIAKKQAEQLLLDAFFAQVGVSLCMVSEGRSP